MQPRLTFLNDAELDRIIDGAFEVLARVGVHVGSERVMDIVASQPVFSYPAALLARAVMSAQRSMSVSKGSASSRRSPSLTIRA